MSPDDSLNDLSSPGVRVRFFGPFGETARKSGDETALSPEEDLFSFLKDLAGDNGERFRDELFNVSGELREDVMITVNDAIVKHEYAAETKLKQGDVVTLFPVFIGGG